MIFGNFNNLYEDVLRRKENGFWHVERIRQPIKYRTVKTTIDDKDWRIELTVPGHKKEDFRIELSDDILEISGPGVYETYAIPAKARKKDISATYEAGVLKIVVPLKEKKKINIEIK